MNPDVLVAAALIILSIMSVLLIGVAIPMMLQAGRTLLAYERLAQTLSAEINPTLNEVVQLLDGINSLRSATTQRITQVGHNMENVADSMNEVADVAKEHSSVWAAGLFAGLRAYLESHEGTKSNINKPTTKAQ